MVRRRRPRAQGVTAADGAWRRGVSATVAAEPGEADGLQVSVVPGQVTIQLQPGHAAVVVWGKRAAERGVGEGQWASGV